jgi:F-type H+-transporting ATPase subunit epsilon
MSANLKLTILTPERKIFNGEVKELNTENEFGRLEILPSHIAMTTSLVPTVTMFTTVDGKPLRLFTSTALLKIENNELILICETAEWPEEINIDRAEEALKKADKLLHAKHGEEHLKAELKLRRALARIKAKH